MSHCSQNVLSLWLRQRWPGRWVKHAPLARSTFHTLHSWGSLTGSNISTGAVPSAPHTRTGPESRALLGVVVLTLGAFLANQRALNYISRQTGTKQAVSSSQTWPRSLPSPPLESLLVVTARSPFLREVREKVTPVGINGEFFFSTHSLPCLDCDFLVRKRTTLC